MDYADSNPESKLPDGESKSVGKKDKGDARSQGKPRAPAKGRNRRNKSRWSGR